MFFFEKKNQKTFALALASRAAAIISLTHAVRLNILLFLLFFKKRRPSF